MRLCLSYKCKEERGVISELERLLEKEEGNTHSLRGELNKLKEENKRLAKALNESTEAYNKAVAVAPVNPCGPVKKGRKKNEENNTPKEEPPLINPLQVFLSAIASANKK